MRRYRIIRALKTLMLIIGIIGMLLICNSCNNEKSSVDLGEKIEQYMQDVYAPKSMKQFKEAKEDSRQYFTTEVTDRFFVAYNDELTEADLERSCSTYITHGKAENQSDGIERYSVKAYLYNHKYAKPIIKEFVFLVNNQGKVYEFKISD